MLSALLDVYWVTNSLASMRADLWLANTIYKISSREPNMCLLAYQDYSAWLTGMKAEYHA